MLEFNIPALEQRLMDVAFGVALLLAVAVLAVRLVWQPAKRLWVIQWTLVGGLVLFAAMMIPMQRMSLGLLASGQQHAAVTDSKSSTAPVDIPGEGRSQSPTRSEVSGGLMTVARPALDAPAGDSDVRGPAGTTSPRSRVVTTANQKTNDWPSWPRIILTAYLSGAGGMFLWLIVGQCAVHWLVRRATPADAALSILWESLRLDTQAGARDKRRLGRTQLLVSSDISQPVAVGVFRPAVLLPKWLTESVDPQQLRLVLAHELAHTARGDAVLRLLAAAFQVAFYYQPCYWWLCRELRQCQEYLADAQAAAHASSARDYAEQLVTLLKSVPTRMWRPLPVIGIVEGRSELYRRIQMLLQSTRPLEWQSSRRWKWITGIALVASSQLLGFVTLRAADPAPVSKQAATAQSEPANAVTPPQSDAQSTRVALATDRAKPKPILPTFRFRVVDKQGRGVAGATVRPINAGLTDGGQMRLASELCSTTTTDLQGTAQIKFLKEWPPVEAIAYLGSQRMVSMTLQVEHPEYPIWSDVILLNAENKIELANPTIFEIHAHREGETGFLRDLYPDMQGAPCNWSQRNGLLKILSADLSNEKTPRWLRVVHIPDDGNVSFSDLIDLKKQAGNPISLDLTLKPGVRVQGRLDKRVPRPVKNGHVAGFITREMKPYSRWSWTTTAEIAPDGTFELASLPANEDLQLVAYCDGWVSRAPTQDELDVYRAQHDFGAEKADSPESTMVYPRLHRLDAAKTNLVVPMDRTATCELQVIDQNGDPVSDVLVNFCPNQVIHHLGSTSIGWGRDSLTWLKSTSNPENRAKNENYFNEQENKYTVKTDDQGIALVPNLPAGRDDGSKSSRFTLFTMWREGYLAVANMPEMTEQVFGSPMLYAQVQPGETKRVTMWMRKQPTPGDETESAKEKVAEDELAGLVVDEHGQPIEDVKVLIWEDDEEKIRTDKSGAFRKQIKTSNADEKHLLVRLIKPGYAPYFVLDWPLGSPRTIALQNSTYFEGTIRTPDGKPAADVLVRANQGPKEDNPRAVIGELWTETRSDAEGHYKLLVHPDWYTIDVRAPGIGVASIPKAGDKATDPQPDNNLLPAPQRPKLLIKHGQVKQLDIQLEAGVSFRAKAVDGTTGEPITGARLWHWQYPDIEGRTDDSGQVEIAHMPEGDFTFMIEAPGYVRGWSDEITPRMRDYYAKSGEHVAIVHGLTFDLSHDMQPVTIKLEPGVTVTGRVLDPDGQPVAGATVVPVRSGSHRSISGVPIVTTGLDGDFTVLLPPNDGEDYNLMTHDGAYQEWRTWANGVGQPFQAKSGEKIENVELRLTRGGVIRGRVVDEQGEPQAGVYVQTTASDRLENNYYNPSTRTGQDGQFELRFVRPGKHRLHGWMLVEDEEKEREDFPIVEVKWDKTATVGDVQIPPQFRESSYDGSDP